jgi:hypothetical protein
MKKKKKLHFKKELKKFMKDERGNISEKEILKLGLGTIAALGVLASFPGVVSPAHSNSHSSNIAEDFAKWEDVPGHVNCKRIRIENIHSNAHSNVHGSY